MKKLLCLHCGKPFIMTASNKRHCSSSCRRSHSAILKTERADVINNMYTELTLDPEFKTLAINLDAQRK